jgi:hypothetical protein
MRLTISEIKEKAEVGDKFDFPAIVEKVYQMQKKNLQYAVGIQNVIVKDDSDKITVGMFIKNEEDAFDKNLEGKKVQVSGEYSTFQKNGKLYKNISKGKILIQEDTQKSDNSKSNNQSQQVSHNITPEQIRIECLKITLQHVDMLEEKTADTRDIINNAKLFEKYVTGNKIEGAVNTPEKAVEKAMEKAELKEKKEDPDLDLKVKTINYIMELTKENQSMNLVDDFVSKCGQENIKELTLKQLETLVSKLENTDESKIPF